MANLIQHTKHCETARSQQIQTSNNNCFDKTLLSLVKIILKIAIKDPLNPEFIWNIQFEI